MLSDDKKKLEEKKMKELKEEVADRHVIIRLSTLNRLKQFKLDAGVLYFDQAINKLLDRVYSLKRQGSEKDENSKDLADKN